MKSINIILFAGLFLVSCHSVLDKTPLDEITEATFWNSATDLELYINGFYPMLRGNVNYYNNDNNSDNMQPLSPNSILDGSRSVPATGGGWGWADVREINYFLENAAEVTEGNQADINHYLGEGYFFRAFLYFAKVKRFGDVPWYDRVLNIDSEELYAPRERRDVIIDHIIADLDNAISRLKTRNDIGATRINKECALLFKSRVCLYEGTWEKYHAGTVFGVEGSTGEKYLNLAVQSAEELMNIDGVELFSTGEPATDYFNLFGMDDLSGNSEALLIETVDPTQDLGTWTWTYLNGQRGNGTGITKSLIQDYLDINGMPIGISNVYEGDETLSEVVSNRDPRLNQSLWTPGKISINSDPPVIFKVPPLEKGASDMTTTGYMVRKGSTVDPTQNTGSSTDRYGKVDGMVFRYAEALLNFAEAKAELGTITQGDLDRSINLIRQRAGMPDLTVEVGFVDPQWDFPSLSPIINEIRRERRVELAFEGFRHDDLMWWKAAHLFQGIRLKGARFIKGVSFPEIEDQISEIPVDDQNYIDRYQAVIPSGFSFDENRDYLFPIPTNELTLNENLDQNPGW